MRKLLSARLILSVGISAVGLMLLAGLPNAQARPNYKKEFEAKYPEVVKAQEGGKINCNTCHEGTSKKNRNIYGKALAKKLDGKKITDADKIKKALTETEKEKSAVEGKTFGDLLKEKKLPASK